MLYAILAYHVEAEVMSWTPEEDAAVMVDLHRVHDHLTQEGRLLGVALDQVNIGTRRLCQRAGENHAGETASAAKVDPDLR